MSFRLRGKSTRRGTIRRAPEPQITEFVSQAKQFLEESPNKSVDDFIEFIKKTNFRVRNGYSPAIIEARKAFYLIQSPQQPIDVAESNDVTNAVSLTDDKHTNEVEEQPKVDGIKRKFSENKEPLCTEIEPKKLKLSNDVKCVKDIDFDNYFIFRPKGNISFTPLLPFPESLQKKMASYIECCCPEFCRFLITGPRKCGKTDFIRSLSEKLSFQFVEVKHNFIRNFYNDEFWQSVEELSKEHAKLLFHFNLTCMDSDSLLKFVLDQPTRRYSAKIVVLIESQYVSELQHTFDVNVKWPKIGKVDRTRFVEHFLKSFSLSKGLTNDEIASMISGYEIGHVKGLSKYIQASIDGRLPLTKDILSNLIKSHRQSVVDVIPLYFNENVSLPEVFDHEFVKTKLNSIIKNLVYDNFPQSKAAATIENNVLLYGPSGSGKTLLVNSLSQIHELPLFTICCADIISNFHGPMQKSILDFFDRVQRSQPSILFLDSVDKLCNSKSRNDFACREFISYLDKLVGNAQQVFVVGAANNRADISDSLMKAAKLGTHIEVWIPRTYLERFSFLMEAFKTGKFLNLTSQKKILEEISSDSFTDGWSQAKLSEFAKAVIAFHLKSKDQFITENHTKSVYRNMKMSGIMNDPLMSKLFDNSLVTLADELDIRIDSTFPYDNELMDKAKYLLSRLKTDLFVAHIKVAGLGKTGKTNFIYTVAKLWHFNVVSLKSSFANNFNEDEFWRQVIQFADAYGDTIIHIDYSNLPIENLSDRLHDSCVRQRRNKNSIALFMEHRQISASNAKFYLTTNHRSCCDILIEKYALPLDSEELVDLTDGWTLGLYSRLAWRLRGLADPITENVLNEEIAETM